MKLTEEQREMIAVPVIIAMWLSSLVIPAALAFMTGNPAWLLLWIACAVVSGATSAVLKGWVDR